VFKHAEKRNANGRVYGTVVKKGKEKPFGSETAQWQLQKLCKNGRQRRHSMYSPSGIEKNAEVKVGIRLTKTNRNGRPEGQITFTIFN
jgi:hypothetical protein